MSLFVYYLYTFNGIFVGIQIIWSIILKEYAILIFIRVRKHNFQSNRNCKADALLKLLNTCSVKVDSENVDSLLCLTHAGLYDECA